MKTNKKQKERKYDIRKSDSREMGQTEERELGREGVEYGKGHCKERVCLGLNPGDAGRKGGQRPAWVFAMFIPELGPCAQG